ncbi:hypothetical protein QYF61_025168, partial [Mycteria americana]
MKMDEVVVSEESTPGTADLSNTCFAESQRASSDCGCATKSQAGRLCRARLASSPSNRGWRLNRFPGQPVPMLDHPFSEVKFPNIQSKPPLAQLEAISSRPIACYLGEETDPHLTTTSFQVVVERDKVSPQPPFLQAKQPQFPQPLLIRLLLQTLHQLRCCSLDTLQHLNVSLVVRGPKLNTVFEGHDHFPSPAGHAIFDTSQDAIGFLGCLGTLPAHIQAAVNQHPQVLFHQAAFQPLFPKPVALHGVVVTQVQDPALGLVEPHTIGLGPSIQPVQVPLQSLPTLKQINTPTQLGVICKLTEGALDPLIQIIDKDIKQNWPQHRAPGNTACDWPPTGVNSIHHHSLGPAIQPVLNPAKSTPVQAMSSQFLQENAMGNHPTEVKLHFGNNTDLNIRQEYKDYMKYYMKYSNSCGPGAGSAEEGVSSVRQEESSQAGDVGHQEWKSPYFKILMEQNAGEERRGEERRGEERRGEERRGEERRGEERRREGRGGEERRGEERRGEERRGEERRGEERRGEGRGGEGRGGEGRGGEERRGEERRGEERRGEERRGEERRGEERRGKGAIRTPKENC